MPNKKLVLITLDGCRYNTAVDQLGFLNHFTEHQLASRYKIIAETPSNSRPLYEVLLTGLPAWKNRVFTNYTVRRSHHDSLFSLAAKAGKTTGAAAYYWVSELYNRAPFSIFEDRIQDDEQSNIQHGMFYMDDDYPDSHLFADAHHIIRHHAPDFMYVHSMNIDDIGHKHTADSIEYRRAVNRMDTILGVYIPLWIDLGYQIAVTSDHGMDDYGNHGGTLPEHREVPLFLIADDIQHEIREDGISQLHIAPLMCSLLGISKGEEMLESVWHETGKGRSACEKETIL